jgi:hypothetical protein
MQIGTLVRQVETAEMANQIADENGQITQKQSETALRASMRIAEAEQRAWVESELTLLEPMTLVRQEVSAGIGVAFENSGHSPAVNAKVAMRFVEWPSLPPNADRSASDAYWRREMRKTAGEDGKSRGCDDIPRKAPRFSHRRSRGLGSVYLQEPRRRYPAKPT